MVVAPQLDAASKYVKLEVAGVEVGVLPSNPQKFEDLKKPSCLLTGQTAPSLNRTCPFGAKQAVNLDESTLDETEPGAAVAAISTSLAIALSAVDDPFGVSPLFAGNYK